MMRMPAARHQWAGRCPSQDHRARTPLLVVAAPTPRWQASGLCFVTTEWPLRGQQALRQPRNCTAVGLSARAWARGAEAALEACASLCMSHWSARGGKKTLRAPQKPGTFCAVRPRDAPYAQRRAPERFSRRLCGRNRLPTRLAATDPAPNGAGHAVKQFYANLNVLPPSSAKKAVTHALTV